MISVAEKKTYVERIDKKALQENISIKHAARALGLKDWRYWAYKNDIKRSERSIHPSEASPKDGQLPAGQVDHGVNGATPTRHNISFDISQDVYDALVKRADGYATEPALIAKIILHDAVRKGVSSNVPHNGGDSLRQNNG